MPVRQKLAVFRTPIFSPNSRFFGEKMAFFLKNQRCTDPSFAKIRSSI
jgi:hypothetical protein